MTREFSAVVQREGDLFVAQCLDVDVASQGASEDEALANLQEALEAVRPVAAGHHCSQSEEQGPASTSMPLRPLSLRSIVRQSGLTVAQFERLAR